MGLLLETMSAFTTILKGSARPTNYQTLSTSDDDRAISIALATDERQRGQGEKHDPAVYLSFWLFGAGTLLGWSGMFTHFITAMTHVQGEDVEDVRATELTWGYSTHVHVSSAGLVLPARIENWAKSTQSIIDSILFRSACIPRSSPTASRSGMCDLASRPTSKVQEN